MEESPTITTPISTNQATAHGRKLKRKIENGEIVKRDDNTIITNTFEEGAVKSKLIKFYEGTEYQIERSKIRIEKAGEPFITCLKSNITVVSD